MERSFLNYPIEHKHVKLKGKRGKALICVLMV